MADRHSISSWYDAVLLNHIRTKFTREFFIGKLRKRLVFRAPFSWHVERYYPLPKNKGKTITFKRYNATPDSPERGAIVN